MVRKTKEDASITRNHILDAAVECFIEQGVSQTTLDAIAQRAGVTRGAIYWYFENKADILSAMTERLACPLQEQAAAGGLLDDPLAFLRAATKDFLDRVAHDQNFYRLIEIFWHRCEYVGEMAELRRKNLDEGEDYIDILLRAFKLAKERGQIGTALTPHQATIALVSLTTGLVFNWTKSNRQMFPMENYGKVILDAFWDALRPNDANNT